MLLLANGSLLNCAAETGHGQWGRATYKRATNSFAFALLVGLLLNLVIVAVLNVAIALEDPFDNVRSPQLQKPFSILLVADL